MNYKEALRAWLDNHDVKLDMYYKGKWVELIMPHNSKIITLTFYKDQEYRFRPEKRKIRVAKFSPLYEEDCEEPEYVTVTPNDYKEISSHPRFIGWVTEEMEVE